MGNSKHRKNHKVKLQQRKNRIAQEKNQYKKFINKQMELIQEQMKNNQSTQVNLAPPANDTSVSVDTGAIDAAKKQNELSELKKIDEQL